MEWQQPINSSAEKTNPRKTGREHSLSPSERPNRVNNLLRMPFEEPKNDPLT